MTSKTMEGKFLNWKNLFRSQLRGLYHRLPLHQTTKWRLRLFAYEYFGPLVGNVQRPHASNIAQRVAGQPLFVGKKTTSISSRVDEILEYLNQSAFADASWTCSRFMYYIWQNRLDLQAAFDLNQAEGRENFARWYLMSAKYEYGLTAAAYSREFLVQLSNNGSKVVRKAAISFLETQAEQTVRLASTPKIMASHRQQSNGANLIGYARGEFGMGEHVRMVARSFDKAKVPFTIIDYEEKGGHGNRDGSVDRWISTEPEYKVNLFHINADLFPKLFFDFDPQFFANRINIGYWAWELAKCPSEFELALNMVDEIWAISDFGREAFAQRSPVPVIKMPLAVSVPELARQYDKRYFGIAEDEFVFLFSFDSASYLERKNPLGVVRAFKAAFPIGQKKVRLILKTMNVPTDNPLWNTLSHEAKCDPRIQVLTSRLTRDEVLGLNSVCDAFVSLHRSEGFGRCLAESMWMGKPVITTNYSGSLDFAHEGTACVVDYQLVPVQEGAYPCWKGQVWADPDIEHASWLMRRLVTDHSFRDYIARAGQAFIKHNFSEKSVGERYAKRLDEIFHGTGSPSSTSAKNTSLVSEFRIGEKERMFGHIDLPGMADDGTRILCEVSEVVGWAVADSGVDRVDVLIDGQIVGRAHYGILRPDIAAAFPNIGASGRSGFFLLLDTKRYVDGIHQLDITVIGISGKKLTLGMTIKIDNSTTDYDLWLKKNAPMDCSSDAIQQTLGKMAADPIFSLVAIVDGELDSLLLGRTLASLQHQLYSNWELVIALGEDEAVRPSKARDRSGTEDRVRMKTVERGNLGSTFGDCKGTYLGIIDIGDILDARALLAFVETINSDPAVDIIYSDEDRINGEERIDPFFKPCWSPIFLCNVNYVGRVWFIKKNLMVEFCKTESTNRELFEHNLLKELAEKTDRVAHIPMVLCSRQAKANSTQSSFDVPVSVSDNALTEISDRQFDNLPLVSIVIPTCLGHLDIVEKCLASLFGRTRYENVEIILIVNNVEDTETVRAFLAGWPAKVLWWTKPFNWSAINNFAAANSAGEYLLFLNDDIEVIGGDWLNAMVRAAKYPAVGAVGATLMYPNRTIQHTGIFLDSNLGVARHLFRFCSGKEQIVSNILPFDRECTAVTGACLLTKSVVFHSIGGFDEALALVCNDTDYGLRLQANGYRCVIAAHTALIHHEGISRGGISETDDVRLFQERWARILEQGDPYINPNLSASRDASSVDPESVGSLVGRRNWLVSANRSEALLGN